MVQNYAIKESSKNSIESMIQNRIFKSIVRAKPFSSVFTERCTQNAKVGTTSYFEHHSIYRDLASFE